MSQTTSVRDRVVKALEDFAASGDTFTLAQLRELVGVEPRTPDEYALWNLWRAVQEAGAVEELATPRQRNRIYHVTDPKVLAAFRTPETIGKKQKTKQPAASMDRRLRDLERRVAKLEAMQGAA